MGKRKGASIVAPAPKQNLKNNSSAKDDNVTTLPPSIETAAPPSDPSEISLKSLLPIDMSDFLATTFRKKALVVHAAKQSTALSGAHQCLSNAMDINDPDSPSHIFHNTSSDSVHLWIKDETTTSMAGKLKSITVPDPQVALILSQSGKHASYCRAPPDVEQPLVANFLRELGICAGRYDPADSGLTGLEGRGEVEVFVGTEGHYTDWHYDFQENFTFQLSGSKRWRLRQSDVKSPQRGVTPHYLAPGPVENQLKTALIAAPSFEFAPPFDKDGKPVRPDEAPFTVVDMKAGDFMYFPAGMWHSVETLEPGVSLNVSLMGTTYADVYCEALKHMLMRDESWREVVMDERGAAGLQDLIQGKLMKVVKELDAGMILPPAQLEKKEVVVEEGGGEDDDGWEEEEEDGDGGYCIDEEFGFRDSPGMGEFYSWKGQLRMNPLCVLMDAKDVAYFDAAVEDGGDCDRFIANVNFAGSSGEAMASAVRSEIVAEKQGKAAKFVQRVLQERGEWTGESASGEDYYAWLFYLGVVVIKR